MPTARPGPQTLLLTALALLIVAATIMLACGPAAQPSPDAGDTLPAAPQAAGGGEEPAAEPTDTPVAEKPAVADAPAQGIDAGKDTTTPEVAAVAATPTPEVAAVAATPTPEPVAATNTPTPQPATPTDTPTPEVLAKAAVPVTTTPEKIAPQETENTESPEPTATPTPRPTICLDGGERMDLCYTIPAPTPTPKYPQLGSLTQQVQSYEETQSDSSQVGGASGQSDAEIPTVFVRIGLLDQASTDALLAWLKENRVPMIPDWQEGDKGFIKSYGDGYIYVVVQVPLLVPISRREGYLWMHDGCWTSFC